MVVQQKFHDGALGCDHDRVVLKFFHSLTDWIFSPDIVAQQMSPLLQRTDPMLDHNPEDRNTIQTGRHLALEDLQNLCHLC